MDLVHVQRNTVRLSCAHGLDFVGLGTGSLLRAGSSILLAVLLL